MSLTRSRRVLPATLLLVLSVSLSARAALPKVPEGFEVRLVAIVPAVLYPCQVGTAPDGSLFVAEDPMDQVGPYEAYNGRILLFREGKEPVVFAEGFRAIFGMAWRDGSLYVSHMPFLSVIRDADGDGKADHSKDLFKDLGPTANRGLNDHIVSGLQFGMDGYLYIAVGDKGIPKATGPDGRTIQLIGGGIIRCRPDGTGIEVFSSGTRNHLEPNLDDRENLFTYDNTDDGLGWWTRVTHHIETGYYGYPYDYHDDTYRMLPRMAEYGGGSPCGALFYKEDIWPEKYRGVGFWAEWGKGKVQAFRFVPDGSTFQVGEAFDFAVPNGVKNFRPIDLALSHDGRTLYVADWNMGGWGSKTEKVGRIFAITYTGEVKTRPRGRDSDPIAAQLAQLDHPSFNERMRAQAALIKQGRARPGRRDRRPGRPQDRPGRPPAPDLGGRWHRGGHARGDHSAARRADVARGRRPGAGGPRARRAYSPARRGAADRPGEGSRVGRPAPGDHRARPDREPSRHPGAPARTGRGRHLPGVRDAAGPPADQRLEGDGRRPRLRQPEGPRWRPQHPGTGL